MLSDARKKKGIEMDYVYDWSQKGEEKMMPSENHLKKTSSINKPEMALKEDKRGQSLTKMAVQSKMKQTETTVKDKMGKSGNLNKVSTNQNVDTKKNFVETIAGQKISGPKIAVIKR